MIVELLKVFPFCDGTQRLISVFQKARRKSIQVSAHPFKLVL
jgi:hypothetical protein